MSELGTASSPLVLGHPMRVALLAAELVANRLRARPALRLILPTGHTPLGMYAALRAHAADGSLPSERATLFQLDEYLGLGPADTRSYAAYLRHELAGIRFHTVHTLDGSLPDPEAQCARHQELLDEAPIDLAVLGLGRDGHVAFDEPGSRTDAGMRRVELHPSTRADAAGDFGGSEHVPREALTVGLRTLLEARELLMLVSGAVKADALRAMLEGNAGLRLSGVADQRPSAAHGRMRRGGGVAAATAAGVVERSRGDRARAPPAWRERRGPDLRRDSRSPGYGATRVCGGSASGCRLHRP